MITVEVAPDVWARCRLGPPGDAGRSDHLGDLSAAEKQPSWRASQLLAGRALLRALLADVAPDAADAGVVKGPRGKPVLAGWPDLGINISHDGDWVAAAVAPGRAVGIDVQRPSSSAFPSLIDRCAGRHADQVGALGPPEQARELAWIWTAQEACVKAQGTGLSGRPWLIDVPPGSTAGHWHRFAWRSLRELSPTPLSCAWKETP